MLVEVKKAGGLLDYKVLIHHTGDEFSVVTMSKFPSWDAINKGAGWGAAFKIIEPDKNERQKISDSWNWVFEGASHIDNIYTEATHTPDK